MISSEYIDCCAIQKKVESKLFYDSNRKYVIDPITEDLTEDPIELYEFPLLTHVQQKCLSMMNMNDKWFNMVQ